MWYECLPGVLSGYRSMPGIGADIACGQSRMFSFVVLSLLVVHEWDFPGIVACQEGGIAARNDTPGALGASSFDLLVPQCCRHEDSLPFSVLGLGRARYRRSDQFRAYHRKIPDGKRRQVTAVDGNRRQRTAVRSE